MTSIKDLLQKGKQRSSEDTQLRLALELSKQEHIKEQQRLLRQFSKPIQRKRRIIQKEEEEEEEEDEEEEDWFQTISSRPQHKNQAKRETVNRAKREILKQEEPFEFDLSSIFEEQPQQQPQQEQQQEQQEEDNEFFKDNADNSLPMVSDAESDCSVIDLCNQDTNQTNTKSVKQNVEQSVEQSLEQSVGGIPNDNDGYLSPLEGFVSLNDSERSEQYLAQFAPKPTRKRKTTTTTSTSKRKKTNKRWYKKKTNK